MSIDSLNRTYTTFGGADIVASFNGMSFAELQGITYSISREKVPVYTMGDPNPRSFSRGKRGIAGTLVFTVFNRDALLLGLNSKYSKDVDIGIQKFKANISQDENPYMSVDDWDKQMSSLASNGSTGIIDGGRTGATVNNLVATTKAHYVDELLPFDITISFANEYGQKAKQVIYGTELLNEGGGFSVDNVTSEKAYTFIARAIDSITAVGKDADNGDIMASY